MVCFLGNSPLYICRAFPEQDLVWDGGSACFIQGSTLISMQFSSPSLISTLSLPSTSMGDSRLLSSESFYYSLRLSFDAESFIEFDPMLMSLRWSIKSQEEEASESSLDMVSILQPSLSLVSQSNRHQSGRKGSGTVSKRQRFGLAFGKYLWFLLMKICRRKKWVGGIAGGPSAQARNIERARGSKVFGVGTESSISDAVLHCKNSNLSSLMDGECKA